MREPAQRREWARPIAGLAVGFAVVMAALLLAHAYAMLAGLKLRVNDYGTYVNFLWNSAHGRPFRCFVDQSYLRTHLSFTLLLLAPLFRLWDDPFLLMVVQWACPVLGAVIVGRTAARLSLPAPLPAVCAALFFAYPYTQSVLTCDFHGVALYLLLLPWLYHHLTLRRPLVWLPWLLILGLREDAAFVMLPLLLYVAWTRRWRGGYVFAGLAVAYAAAAILWLYPRFNEMSLAARRAVEMDAERFAGSWDAAGLWNRAQALFWLFLPSVPLWRRGGWAPALVFPSLALLLLQVSHEPRVHGLGVHYPAAVWPLAALGLLEALARGVRQGAPLDRGSAARLGAVLLGLLLAAHFTLGRFPREIRQSARRLTLQPSRSGRNALWAARHIPREGVLLTDRTYAGLCGNRADLLAGLHLRTNAAYRIDAVFLDLADSQERAVLREFMTERGFGVTYFDQRYAIAQRGAAPARNAEAAEALANRERTVVFHGTARRGGRGAFAPGCDTARYWSGRPEGEGVDLTLGGRLTLPAGVYRARFRLRAEAPRQEGASWGALAVVSSADERTLAAAAIEPVATPPGEFRYQELRFALERETAVEPRVTGAAAPLWLDRAIFVPVPDGEAPPAAPAAVPRGQP